MKNLIERLQEYSQSLGAYHLGCEFSDFCDDIVSELERLQIENTKLIAANKAVALDNRQLRNELEQVKTERDELIRRNQSAYEIAWGCDIPSPTVPEYIELHEGMMKVMNALRDQKG